MEGYHSSVLLDEVIDALGVKDTWYLDCTLGDAGHSIEIIKRGGRIIGIDVDPQALERVRKRFEQEGIGKDKYRLVQGNFRDLKNLISSQADTVDLKIAGAIFDLGVSSLQLESSERGFSFMKEGPLDMRMDPTLGVRALDLITIGGRKELYELFRNLGEEKYSKRLADALVRAREIGKIQTTKDLADLAERIIGRSGKIHPATKVFQALRIAVNDELEALKEGLEKTKDLIRKDSCIVVISFHSLEDRIVKVTFREWEDKRIGEVLTKKPIVPSQDEVEENPRSRSAKMRIFRVFGE